MEITTMTIERIKKENIHLVDFFVGNRIRQYRRLKKMSQKALGESCQEKITFQQIQKYETGSNRIGSSRLYEFSQILGVPIEDFFKGFKAYEAIMEGRELSEDEAASAAELPVWLETKETIKIIGLYHDASPEMKRIVIKALRMACAQR